MADSFTVHRGYTKPEDGASADTWGVKLNNDFDSIDTDVYGLLTDANYAEDTGSANALVVTPVPAQTEYREGLTIRVRVAQTNTGSATINVNGLGAKNILANDGSNLNAGELTAGGVYLLTYDGTQFRTASKSPLASAADIAEGTSTSKVMTPGAFAANAAIASSGHYELPGGLIVQWGFISASVTADGSLSMTFPTPFASACYSMTANVANPGAARLLDFWVQIVSLSTTGAELYIQMAEGGSGTVTGIYWQAFGK